MIYNRIPLKESLCHVNRSPVWNGQPDGPIEDGSGSFVKQGMLLWIAALELHNVKGTIISVRQYWLRASMELSHSVHERNCFDNQGKNPLWGSKIETGPG
jgi:hypothetical protein